MWALRAGLLLGGIQLMAQPVWSFEIWGSGPTESSDGWQGWDLDLLKGTASVIFSDMPVEAAHSNGIGFYTTCGPSPTDMATAASRAAFASTCAKR